MEAPRLRSMFRNVRTEPRRFEFKSRHLPDVKEEGGERKRRVEREVLGVSDDDGPTQIRFRKGSSPVDSRRQRRQASIRDARRAMIRAVLIAGVLFYAAYRGLQWVEENDFGGIIEAIKNG